jgi:hypothetical protein
LNVAAICVESNLRWVLQNSQSFFFRKAKGEIEIKNFGAKSLQERFVVTVKKVRTE